MDTGKSLRKTGISPSGEIPSCPHNALLEVLSRNHARVVPDGFLRDLPVSRPPELFIKIANALFNKINNLFYHWHFLLYERAELSASALLQRIRGEIPQLHPLRLASAATSTRE